MNASPTDNTWPHERNELRRALRARRREWWASPDARLAEDRLGEQLQGLLRQLEPLSLGLYWALDGEFNAADWALAHKLDVSLQLALPFARKAGPDRGPARMSFHRWDGKTPTEKDECDIPTATGAVLVTSDRHLLDGRPHSGVVILTPGEFAERAGWRRREPPG